jgi:hypothetical protein
LHVKMSLEGNVIFSCDCGYWYRNTALFLWLTKEPIGHIRTWNRPHDVPNAGEVTLSST